MSKSKDQRQIGLGLIGIGRPWGTDNRQVPDEAVALKFLEGAYEAGIRFFDTAPAYGMSEERLGRFLRMLGLERDRVTVATKMGEEWDQATGVSQVDHSAPKLQASFERSIDRLGRIEMMQVHKATEENIMSDGVRTVIERARRSGVQQFGASVSDLPTARAVVASGLYDALQFPFNSANPALKSIFSACREASIDVLINRPLGMGQLVADAPDPIDAIRRSLAFILTESFTGHILSGTKNLAHLKQNLSVFRELA